MQTAHRPTVICTLAQWCSERREQAMRLRALTLGAEESSM